MSIPITNLTTPLAAFAALWPQGGYKIVFAKGSPILLAWSVKDAQGNAIASPLDAEGNPSAALLAADAAAALAAAKTAKALSLSNGLKTALLAEFTGLTPAQQYMLNGARLALNDDLTAGNMANAIAGVTNFILPDPSLGTAQTTILGILNTYAPKFAALEAATTVDAVNDIN